MQTIRRTTLLTTTSLLTRFAAVALTSVARTTDVKHPPTSAVAAKPPPQKGFARPHHCPGNVAGQWPQAVGGWVPELSGYPVLRGHVTAPAVDGDRGFPFSGYDDIRMAGSFSRRRREMILLSTLSDFLYQKTALLGERQHRVTAVSMAWFEYLR